jgi:DNA topoisomerase-1
MAFPGPGGPPEPSHKNGHYRKTQAEQATTVMMDQQNFEATRPVSADPAVALAEALGQLPKAPAAKPQTAVKTSVEALAQELGLKLGDQNELTIRRIKRGKSYSFIRANGTAIRHVGTIKRLNSMAVPPAYQQVRYSPDPASHLQAVGRDAAGRLQYRYHADWEKVRSSARRIGWRAWLRPCRKSAVTSRCICPATRRPGNSRCRP